MTTFKNDKGLTLIELLITIAVLAVVSAIALPVINNVVSASNSNALQQTIKDADAFINKYSKSGVVAYDGLTRTFQGYVDTDGDNTIDSNELIDTLTLDAKFSATANGTSPSVGGSYSNGGVTGVTISSASAIAPTPPPTANPLVVTSVGSRSFVAVYATSPNWSAEYPYLYMNANEYFFWTHDRFMEFAYNGAMTANPDGSVNFNDWGTGTVTRYDANPLVTPGANIVPITLP
jgi:prepilin-type N-terminal cleavage/methylation domain-containing protein